MHEARFIERNITEKDKIGEDRTSFDQRPDAPLKITNSASITLFAAKSTLFN
jgi:hypothetical protein